MNIKEEITQEIQLAEMMAKDLDIIFRKYTKSAQIQEEKRIQNTIEKKYFNCSTAEELQDMYGFGDISENEYYNGLDFFEELKQTETRKSLVELHRQNVKELRNKWKGTVNELKGELDVINGVVKGKQLGYVEQLEAQEREERYNIMRSQSLL